MCYRSQYFEGGRIITAAISAIDIALHDLLGKRLCVPVYQLLGGRQRDVIPTFDSFCQMLPPGTLDFLEEPIRSESAAAYAALRTMTGIPFAVGEEFASKWQAAPFIDQQLTQFMRLDICNVGGFTEAMKIAGWCETSYIDLMPHNPLGPICTAATVHLSAAVPNLSWVETRQSPVESLGFHDRRQFPVQIDLDGPVYPVPETPGLGVVVDEAELVSAGSQPVECPHLVRPDGSVTNW